MSESHQALVEQLAHFPRSRYMGSKQALLPTLRQILEPLTFETALDAFSGSAAVSYLLKALGKTVYSNDFLAIAYHTAAACVANNTRRLTPDEVERLLTPHPVAGSFVQTTFSGLYFSDAEHHLLDHILARLAEIDEPAARSLATAAVVRACLRRQPRGIFTFTGHRYDDGRRDLRLPLDEQIRRAVTSFNRAVFDSGRPHQAFQGDIFALPTTLRPDLVYIDPPYVSRHSDNDYTRRYHFVEGLARAWQGLEIQLETSTRKFRRLPSRFDRRTTIYGALSELFERFREAILVVSYSSNSLPSRDEMMALLGQVKPHIEVYGVDHRYSFGTHQHRVGRNNNAVEEYLFVAR